MTVFELQVDPDRNAVIRRALAKRIVLQREEEEEEASTEEDESFLSNSITIVRKGASASPSLATGGGVHHPKRRRAMSRDSQGSAGENPICSPAPAVHIHAKSRWKREYLRITSSSPSGSFISAISEIMPEILPEIMPEISLNGDKPHANGHGDVHFQSTAATITPNADAITMADSTAAAVCDAGAAVRALSLSSPKPSPAIVTLGATETTAATTATTTIMAGASKDTDKEVVSEANGIHVANGTTDYDGTMTPPPSSPGMMVKATEEVVSVDQVEQDLLAKLEELRKEKSRLFSLFRASLIKGQDMRSPEPPCAETSGSNMEEPTSRMSTTDMSGPRMIQALSLLSNGLSNSSLNGSSSLSREMNGSATAESADEVKKPSRTRKSSDQEYDKKPEPLRLNGKRREHGVIDRSKLNLEIPRKPSVCSMSSSSTTSSTPTPTSAGFAPPSSSSSSSSSYASKGKRPRSNSPTFLDSPRSGSGAGSHGPLSSYEPSNKYPRADYLGSAHSRNPSNSDLHHHHHNGSSNHHHHHNNHNSHHHPHHNHHNGHHHHPHHPPPPPPPPPPPHHPHHPRNNGLPEKPQIRHHHSASSGGGNGGGARSVGPDGYHGDDGGYHHHRHKSVSGPSGGGSGSGGPPPSSPLFPPMNGSSGGGPSLYRQMSYFPTRIGFGNSSNGGASNGNSGSNGNSANGSGGGGSSRGGGGGYYNGDGGSSGSSLSKAVSGPPPPPHHQNRPLTFRVPMPHPTHARVSMGGRSGFVSGRAGGGGGGGGFPERSMPDWNRRRGRV